MIPAVPGFIEAWVTAVAAVLAFVTVLWVVSFIRSDVSIIDAFWGPSYVVALVAAWTTAPGSAWALPTLVLVGAWAMRLAMHLAPRISEPEDYRYVAMRERNGPAFQWTSLVRVFWLQGALVAGFGAPLVAALIAPAEPGPLAAAGASLALAGLIFETIADAQLAAFKRDPDSKGRVLDTGLWRYSRHPNYFGEAVVWWGFGIWASAAIVSPLPLIVSLLMTLLLLRVSGVPLLEPHLESTRPGYAAYARRTSPFVPRRPRVESGDA